MDIKESFQIKLNELRGKSSLSDDERKELKDRIRKKHGKAWNDTIDIRKEKKSAGPADTRDMDKLRNRLAKMYNKLEEAADDLSKKSTEELQNFIKDHAGGGVPRFGKGAAVQRHHAELKRRTSKK
jgi:type I site-specific restriction-modification system R (restriction) subunit